MVREILRLGHPTLYTVCDPVTPDEVNALEPVVQDLHDTMMAFRAEHGCGRAIAAPQIGVAKRLVYLHTGTPRVFFNPVLFAKSRERVVLWDDCMSFPELLVRVERHAACTMMYRDRAWRLHRERLTGDLAELLQHEVDHLEGILAVSRAIDGTSFALRTEQHRLKGPICGDGTLRVVQPE